jgi:TolB protein
MTATTRPATLLTAVAIVATLTACGGSNTTSLRDQRIAFVTERNGSVELFVMNADGTGEHRVTRGDAVGYLSEYVPPSSPTWSPDGELIVFTSEHGETPSLYVARADGSGRATLLVRDAAFPAWSPAGDLIAFTRQRDEAEADIWVVRPDGTQPRILVENAGLGAWAPDGRRLVFVRADWDDTDLYVADLDDGSERRLTTTPAPDFLPAWAPAEQIAFVRYLDNSEIFVIDPDGTNERRLTEDPAEDTSPAWSPDGSRIAFTNDLTYTREWLDGEEIFVMAADGSGRTRLTRNEVRDVAPAWQPTKR